MNRSLQWMAALFLFWSSLVAAAPEESAYRAQVREYIELSHSEQMFRMGMEKALASNPDKPVPEPLQRILRLSHEELAEVLVPAHMNLFTPEAMPEIVAFMRSPAGQELASQADAPLTGREVQLSPESIKATEQFLATPAGKVFTAATPRMNDEFRKTLQVFFEAPRE